MHRPLILIGCILASPAAAEPVQMTGEAIKTTFSGSRLDLDTPAGTTIPVRFSEDGLVSGEAGVLAAVLGSSKDRGRWWTEGDKMCLKWFRWFDAKRRCIELKQDGARIFWRDQSGESGTGTLAEQAQVAEKPAALPTPYALGAVEVAKKQPPKPAAHAAPKPPPEPQVAKRPEPEPVEPVPAEAPAAPQTVEAPDVTAQARPIEVAAVELPDGEDTGDIEIPRMQFADAAIVAATLAKRKADVRAAQPKAVDTADGAAAPRSAPVKRPTSEQAPAAKKQGAASSQAVKSANNGAHKRGAEKTADKRTAATSSAPVVKSAPAPVEPPVELFKVAGVLQGDILNVRSGPSEYHAPVGSIAPEGRGVKITGPCMDQWCPIRYKRIRGWVNRTYLVAETAVSSAPQAIFRSTR